MTLPGAFEGLKFYLAPDVNRAVEAGVWGMINAAMTQAFFTLGLGVGSMLIFASYLDRKRTLTGEATLIVALDTFVAFTAGLIIFPAGFAFGVRRTAGRGWYSLLCPISSTAMPGGRLWGSLFLCLHELCRADNGYFRCGEYHFLQHGRVGMEPGKNPP